MGLRGPAPKPTAIKKAEGNPGKRKLNTQEPQPVPGAPECPDHLDAVAKKEWNRLSEVLVAMKVLTEADYIALGNLCQAYCTLIDAQKHLNKDGQQTLVPVPGGAVVELTQSFLDGYRAVDVNWEGKALIMFAQDVRERASLLMDQGWNEFQETEKGSAAM